MGGDSPGADCSGGSGVGKAVSEPAVAHTDLKQCIENDEEYN